MPPHFSLSVASSRSGSPAQSFDLADHGDLDRGRGDKDRSRYRDSSESRDGSPGQKPTDVYDMTLPAWRAAVRRRLVSAVEAESGIIARMQKSIRRPWLDSYFVYTSLLGTHTFFMVMLPMFAFFGRVDVARGLVMVLAAGVYFSSLLKDMFCSPRPFAPPVVRLTIGSHHLEYGFPSTHSTNSVSMALFIFTVLHGLAFPQPSSLAPTPPEPTISPTTFYLSTLLLLLYASSIVFGRLYTAMHSLTDVLAGCALGAGIWWGHTDWPGATLLVQPASRAYGWLVRMGVGQHASASTSILTSTPTSTPSPQPLVLTLGQGLGLGRLLDAHANSRDWRVPALLIPLCLLAVNQHPQPVDDCPCFEDAIAFGSVALGAVVGRWGMHLAGVDLEDVGRVGVRSFWGGEGVGSRGVMPGSGLVWVAAVDGAGGGWVRVPRTWADVGLWSAIALAKMVVGILTIFAWRILAKSLLHFALPPLFRALSRLFQLPKRRFYTPATEYRSVPGDIRVDEDGSVVVKAIPSVMDLRGFGVEVGGIGSGVGGRIGRREGRVERGRKEGIRPVNGKGSGGRKKGVRLREGEKDLGYRRGDEEDQPSKARDVKHYDADVLTKVIVYAGIAFLACEALPLLFVYLGWGLRSWP